MKRLHLTLKIAPLALLALAGTLFGAEAGITREGSYWVKTLTGRADVPASGRLTVKARGGIVVNGGPQHEVTYSVKTSVKAGNEAEAESRFHAFEPKVKRDGDSLSLVATDGSNVGMMQLQVPKTLRVCILRTSDGAIQVTNLDGAVRAETAAGAVKVDRVGGNVTVQTAGGEITLGVIGGNARCITAGGPITVGTVRGEAVLETGGGDVVVNDVAGPLRVATAGGGIKVVHAESTVSASTAGGPVEVADARGMVTAKTSGGPIQVNAATGVHCESAAGGIHLSNISGSLRASTAVGSIVARLLAGRTFSESSLSTSSGDITVVIPSNLGMTVRAENLSSDSVRRIVTDFPGISVKVEGGMVVAEGTLYGGGPLLRISGSGGRIFIRRQQ